VLGSLDWFGPLWKYFGLVGAIMVLASSPVVAILSINDKQILAGVIFCVCGFLVGTIKLKKEITKLKSMSQP
jgi:hypothetical protein